MALLIKNGRVLDPASGLDDIIDILVEGGKIRALARGLAPAAGSGIEEVSVLDATGLVVMPGLIDMHTHLREPGREDAETVLTGSQAAALGGFTCVHAMANTRSAIGRYSNVKKNNRRAELRSPSRENFRASAIMINASKGPTIVQTMLAKPHTAGMIENAARHSA